MPHNPPTRDDILSSFTATAMPPQDILPGLALRNRFQAMDNMARVFAIRPGEPACASSSRRPPN